MNIRPAKKEDINVIWDLGKKVSGFETSKDIVTFWPKSILENCIDKNDVLIVVAESENKIVGFIILNINNSLSKLEIENIYVLEKFRKQGVPKKLLNYAIEEANNRKIENICVMTNDIVDFLINHGFTKGNQFYWMDLALSDRFKR